MTEPFTRGRHAFGFCDICGFRCDLSDLKFVVIKLKVTAIKACPMCWDPDHPQLQLGMYPVIDPQALRDPRIDVNQNVERTLYIQLGAPEIPTIGATVGCVAGALVGQVTVTIH
jgi:hypothetical protein